MSDLIDFALLRSFCWPNRSRPQICDPWVDDRELPVRVLASNGVVLISVDLDEIVMGEGDLFSGWEDAPAVDKIFRPFEWVPANLASVPIGTFRYQESTGLCPECEGAGVVDCDCPACQAKEHDCVECGGDGEIPVFEPRTISVQSRRVSTRVLAQVATLPGVEFLPYTGDEATESILRGHRSEKPLIFRFGKTGRGVLQPLTENKTNQQQNA